MKKSILFVIVGVLLITSVLAWTLQPIDIIVSKDKSIESVDLDTGVKTNLTIEKVDALELEYAKAYADYSKTALNVSKVEVLSQSVKSCISFTYVKFDGVLRTVVSAKGGCQAKLVIAPKEEILSD